jgi:1-acyl-sn-glycerol-3-phosphate acyltransferase
MPQPSLLVSLSNAVDVLWTSGRYLYDIKTREVSTDDCNGRLAGMFHRYLSAAKAHLDVRGDFDRTRSYIVMSNHQSLYDIPVLFEAFGPQLRMVVKKELSRVPLWGPALRASRFVFVDRASPKNARANLLEAQGVLGSGLSVWIAPEGTRSKDGQLGSFKMGGFHMALDTGYPILPVTIDGARNVLAAGDVRTNLNETVRVIFHEPIDPKAFGPNTKGPRQALAEAVRQALAEAVRQAIQGGFAR